VVESQEKTNPFGKSEIFKKKKKSLPKRLFPDSEFPFLALLVDSTTITTFKPLADFQECKGLWDGHHETYGLKKEVGISAHAPHICLFSQKARAGSVNDYQIFKV